MWSEIRLVQELDKITFDLFFECLRMSNTKPVQGFPCKVAERQSFTTLGVKEFPHMFSTLSHKYCIKNERQIRLHSAKASYVVRCCKRCWTLWILCHMRLRKYFSHDNVCRFTTSSSYWMQCKGLLTQKMNDKSMRIYPISFEQMKKRVLCLTIATIPHLWVHYCC